MVFWTYILLGPIYEVSSLPLIRTLERSVDPKSFFTTYKIMPFYSFNVTYAIFINQKGCFLLYKMIWLKSRFGTRPLVNVKILPLNFKKSFSHLTHLKMGSNSSYPIFGFRFDSDWELFDLILKGKW